MSFAPAWNPQSEVARQRRDVMRARVHRLRALERRAADKSAQARAAFESRGQLLPRERVGLLLDAGAPWLPLCALAGYLQDTPAADASLPGGGLVAGIGFVAGVRCMVVASDSGLPAGASQPMRLAKMLRLQEIALANRLPFLQLVDDGGAEPAPPAPDAFVHAGEIVCNLARLSAAGVPVVTVRHGAGSAVLVPELADVVIAVQDSARGGEPGRADYLAQDDRHALGIARQVMGQLASGAAPRCDNARGDERLAVELLSLMPPDLRDAVDLREIIVRLVDEAAVLEFQPHEGAGTVCAQGRIVGHALGFIANNGPLDAAGAAKAARFVRWMGQLGQPIVYLQNSTGCVPEGGQRGSNAASEMIRAVAGATVPQVTIQCGASFGAGNYAMCGRAHAPRFLFSWPGAKTGATFDESHDRTREKPEAQADAFHSSGLLLDDGVIDPRDTRAVLAFCLDTIAEAQASTLRPGHFALGARVGDGPAHA